MDYSFEVKNGSLSVTADGKILFSDVTGYLKYEGGDYNVITVPREGEWRLDGDGRAVCSNMEMELSPLGGGFIVRSVFRNSGENLAVPCEFTAFAGTLACEIDRAVINLPFESNGYVLNEMRSVIDSVRCVRGRTFDSYENAAFSSDGGESFVFGQVTFEKYISAVTLTREGYVTAHCSTEWHPLPRGGEVTSESFWFSPCENIPAGLESYAGTVAEIAGATPPAWNVPTGFCTWYYYGSKISRDKVMQNVAVLDRERDNLPVKYVQIDDGWFDFRGDWNNISPEFPDMAAIAREIREHGYVPGIWLAPFSCSPESKLFREHPDYFVKRPDGTPWRDLSLDYTNPAVREYMGGVFRRVTEEWGYRYVKIDIMAPSLAPGIHHDPDATALANYRAGLRVFRENVTPDTFILGCTAPLGASAGMVDGMRVSCDVFERWESLLDVFNEVLKRWYMNRRYFIIDADCLIIRKRENEDGECWRLCTRTDDEIRTYVTAMAASGGVLMLSDKLPNLGEDQIKLISKLFPANDRAARPLDIAESFVPGVLDLGRRGATRTVALINWTDVPAVTGVDNGEALVWEFWSGEFARHPGGRFETKIPPRCAKVFYFTDPADTAVVGSDASVVMQSEWSRDGGVVTGKRLKKGEHVFLASKAAPVAVSGCRAVSVREAGGYRVTEFAVTGEEYSLRA